MTKICQDCKQELTDDNFEKHRNSCKQCRCKKRRKKHEHTCLQCHKVFTSISKHTKYCGRECSGNSRKRRVKDNCSFCNSEIEYLHKDAKWDYHYCNQDCRGKHLKVLMVGERNPNWYRIEKKCDGCEKDILVQPFDLKNTTRHFCSKDCYKENIGRFYTGENNNFWNPMLTPEERETMRLYPEYNEWRLDVFKRDKFTCQCCGDNTSGNLNAHHILNYSEHKQLRTEVDNGITLCKSCHVDFHTVYGFRHNNHEQLKTYFTNFNKQTTLL